MNELISVIHVSCECLNVADGCLILPVEYSTRIKTTLHVAVVAVY